MRYSPDILGEVLRVPSAIHNRTKPRFIPVVSRVPCPPHSPMHIDVSNSNERLPPCNFAIETSWDPSWAPFWASFCELFEIEGVVSVVAGLIGVWAVFFQSRGAARVFTLSWPFKFALAVVATIWLQSVGGNDGVEQRANLLVWFATIFFFLYYTKVGLHCFLCLSSCSVVRVMSCVDGTLSFFLTLPCSCGHQVASLCCC